MDFEFVRAKTLAHVTSGLMSSGKSLLILSPLVAILFKTITLTAAQAPVPSPQGERQGISNGAIGGAQNSTVAAAANDQIHELLGRVVDSTTGRPLSGVSVGIGGRYFATDVNGTVSGTGLYPGDYLLTASRAGYLLFGLRPPRPDQSADLGNFPQRGVKLSVLAGKSTSVTIYMLPAPVVEGTVLNTNGRPVEGAEIMAFRVGRDSRGERTFDRMPGGTFTDDTGRFRIESLPPGDYVFRAEKRPIPTRDKPTDVGDALLPAFYPGTTDYSRAEIVGVRPGAVVELRALIMQSFSGVRVRLRLTDENGGDIALSTWGFRTLKDLAATFIVSPSPGYITLPPGVYDVEAARLNRTVDRSPILTDSRLARTTVDVRGTEVDVPLTLVRGPRVSGKIEVVDRNETVSPAAGAQIRFNPKGFLFLDAFPFKAVTNSEGAFEIASLPEGKYEIRVPLSADDLGIWYVNEQDVRSAPRDTCLSEVLKDNQSVGGPDLQIEGGAVSITVRLVRSTTRVEGKVVDARGEGVPSAALQLIPEESDNRGPLTKSADQDGGFAFTCVPAGNYRLYAWREQPQETDRGSLTARPGGMATAVTVTENGRTVTQVTVIGQ